MIEVYNGRYPGRQSKSEAPPLVDRK